MDEYLNKTKFEELMRKKARSNFDLYYDEKSKNYHGTAKHYYDRAIGYSLAAEETHDFPSVDVQLIDRWIDAQKNPPPIIDRKSMTSESVLILRDNGRCSVAYYCNSAEDGDYWTTDDDKTMYCWEEVTHWQPLPELPKGGEVKIAELKPCPFCGGKAVNCMKQYDGRIYRCRIQCDNAGCACRTPWLCYQEDAIEVWNRRT